MITTNKDKLIKTLKDEYKGRRCFIIGNGPSLAKTNLNLLKNDFSFAMNRIARIYNKTLWRPNFFVCTTTNLEDKEWKRDILKTIGLGVTTFAWEKLRCNIGDRGNVYYLNCTNGKEVTSEPSDEWWSDNISKRVTKFGTSLIVAMQIAIYMGFNPIYLVGCDLNYYLPNTIDKLLFKFGLRRLVRDRNHFDPKYDTPGLPADKLNVNMLAAHKLIDRNAKRLKVQIYNATFGGKLEIYPRVSYTSLFSNA